MHRITVSLPDEVAAAVQREARRSAKSVSAVTRDAICSHLHLVVEAGDERHIGFAALGNGGRPGIAERVDEVLETEWNDPDFYRGS